MTQLPNEPADAFAAFIQFCQLGEKRTLRPLYQGGTPLAPERTIKRWSSSYHWQERVREWDANTAAVIEKKWQADKAEDKRIRINYLKAFRAKIGAAMEALKPTDASWGEVSGALKMVIAELRAEHDDEPVQRTEVSGAMSRPSIPPELISDDARREGALLVIQDAIRGEGDEE
jgi:hypothetical protein